MKSVLMIAYNFPPEGNAGAHRPLRFVRHLPSMGWSPTVITVQTDSYERYDSSLLARVPRDVEVIRVRNPDPWQALQARRARRLQQHVPKASADTTLIASTHNGAARAIIREAVHTAEAWWYHPDLAMGWIRPAVKRIVKLCSKSKPDVIWATAGPVSSFVVAQKLSKS